MAPEVNSLASPQKQTPWPVFPNGKHDPDPLSSYYRVATDFFGKNPFFQAMSFHYQLVLGSFHLPFEMLFSVPSRYYVHYRSRNIFRVGTCFSPLPAQYPMHGTQVNRSNTFRLMLTGLSPSMAPRSRGLLLHQVGGDRTLQHHIPSRFLDQVRFALCPFRSPLLRASRLLSFPPLTKMFHLRGFPFAYANVMGFP